MKIALILLGMFSLAAVSIQAEELHHPYKTVHHVVKHADAASGHSVKSGESHSSHKHVKKSGKSSKHDEEAAMKGGSGSTLHKLVTAEGGGKKAKAHEQSGHQAHENAGGGAIHGAQMREGSKHKKTKVSKGFREQYHKAERKKHDSFYSNGQKASTWKSYGAKGAKHQSHKYEKNGHGKHIVLKSGGKHGKKSRKASGFQNGDHKGHKSEGAVRSSHDKHEKWAKTSQQKHQDKQKLKYFPASHV